MFQNVQKLDWQKHGLKTSLTCRNDRSHWITCTGCTNVVTRLTFVRNWWPVRSNVNFWLASVTGFWRLSLVLLGEYVYSIFTATSHSLLFHCGKIYMYTYSFECEGGFSRIVIGKDLVGSGCGLPRPRQLKLGLISRCCQTDAAYIPLTY